jgi:hypothetical protein
MNPLITRWNIVSLKEISLPDRLDFPASPVHSCLKFSAVLGVTFLKSSIVILPAFLLSMLISKKTLGLLGVELGWDIG